jgi:acyl dehydratase/NAD(P)-dependent dehydrogenase (short-subunit alcohol dehydrogenase family)
MMQATRVFSQADQIAFATYSGDWNPIHVDAVYARRTQIGRPVVHGMNALLWALNAFASSSGKLVGYRHLKVDFQKPIYVDEAIVANIVDSPAPSSAIRTLKIGLRAGAVTLVTITLDPSAPAPAAGVARSRPHSATPDSIEPVILDIRDARERIGTVRLASSSPEFELGYADAVAWLGVRRFRGIAALSRIVGMECPGLHSLFMSAQLALVPEDDGDYLDFAVQQVDDRFQFVRMKVEGAGIEGSVTARFRVKPVVQPTLADIAQYVVPGEFAGQTPLIVGGSRGLGELTAKICAAGGARPVITYFTGEGDARRIAEEIVCGGGDCSTIRYDTQLEAAPQLERLSVFPQQVYFFPTSTIARRKRDLFEADLFDEFLQTYVTGFYNLCRALRETSSRDLSMFFPSTSYVDQRPRDMTEYVMAKLAGEILCADLTQRERGLKILVRRLPPLLTDQTAALPNAGSSAQAVEIVLSIVREMARMNRSVPS